MTRLLLFSFFSYIFFSLNKSLEEGVGGGPSFSRCDAYYVKLFECRSMASFTVIWEMWVGHFGVLNNGKRNVGPTRAASRPISGALHYT